MKNRTQEQSNFESEIRNDPFKLLESIKEKMCDPARAKHEYASLTDAINRALVDAKQSHGKDLIDYAKRFKQAKDIFKQTVGDNALNSFVENAKEHLIESKKGAPDADKLKSIKKGAFNKWMAYQFMSNADKNKYGSLMRKLSADYAAGNADVCPDNMTQAGDVLTNHKWDDTYRTEQKKRKQQRQDHQTTRR